MMCNMTDEPYTIQAKERIAQIIFYEQPLLELHLVGSKEALGKCLSSRRGGFGSSGRFKLTTIAKKVNN